MLKQVIILCALLSSQVALPTQAQPLSQSGQVEKAAQAEQAAQTANPDLPAEDKTTKPILALLSAFNSAQADQIKQFIREYTDKDFQSAMPIAEHVAQFQSVARQYGKFHFIALKSVPKKGNVTIKLLQVKDSAYGDYHEITLIFNDDAAPRFVDIRPRLMKAAPENAANNAANAEESKLIQQSLQLVKIGCEKDIFSGSVMLAKDERVLLKTACGEASKRYHVANNIDTKFNLGSMNKMFTAIAIAQLMEQGKLNYQDTIDQWVDSSWLPKKITSQIKLHHLLTHTSGLESFFNTTFEKSAQGQYREVDDLKPLIKDESLRFQPGSDFLYSNTGMHLLGVVIEKVSGQNYSDYIRQHIYLPAGMLNSDNYAIDEPIENLAIGYMPAFSGKFPWIENTYKYSMRGGPAGGGYSTAPDLFAFVQALKQTKLLKPETLQTLWTDHNGHRYGYGFLVKNASTGKVVGHGGAIDGVSAELEMHLDRGYTLIALSNYDYGALHLTRKISQLIQKMPKA
ncbi:serine hydrolase domain-containing protein [Undibacterium flavidum]|uniref:Beta-lactamase family protein n=1 Tax=Undibacterium flavidum TaxID=2762297 RepID=A0ABR6Y640_9BURK|nr:serine hydrolase domain-containing protein [Undibacterium flavidum]MBC3872087.1 beta-lactamase family protein [Undibacterium flavidum]